MSTTALALAQMASVRHAIDRISTCRGVTIGSWEGSHFNAAAFLFDSDEECGTAADFAVTAGCTYVFRWTEHAFWSPNLGNERCDEEVPF